jgi:hypothetical protein
MRRVTTTLIALVATFSASVFAQVAGFNDGFEMGLNKWRVGARTGSLGVNGSQAHRGSQGLRVEDFEPPLGPRLWFTGPNVGSDRFVRMWWKRQDAFLMTRISILTVSSDQDEPIDLSRSLANLRVGNTSGGFVLVCQAPMTLPVELLSPVAVDDVFHLLEVKVSGVGQPMGQCALAVDGVLQGTSAVAYQSASFSTVGIGALFGNGSWEGRMVFDDFAASGSPMASRVQLEPRQISPNLCERLEVSYLSSFTNARAPLSTAMVLRIGSIGASVYVNSACTGPTQQVTLTANAGASFSEIWVRASGPIRPMLTFVSDDLVGSQATLDFVPGSVFPDSGLPTVDAGSVPEDGGGVVVDAAVPEDGGSISRIPVYVGRGCGCRAETSQVLTLLLAGGVLTVCRRQTRRSSRAHRSTAFIPSSSDRRG